MSDHKSQELIDRRWKPEGDPTGEVGFCSNCGTPVPVVVPPTDRLDERIFRAVVKRGYTKGWEPGQFMARQMAKAIEEIYEAMAVIPYAFPQDLFYLTQAAADAAKFRFDHGDDQDWPHVSINVIQMELIARELEDIQVVLVCAAKALEQLIGHRVDLTKRAVEKAENDVKRGVR